MARAAAKPVEEAEEDETNGNFRLSISLDPALRRNIRIAAAYHDLTVGEWASRVLQRAADKAVEEGPQ